MNRFERSLNRVPGVLATVNFATASARVSFPADLSSSDLVESAEATGYGATLPAAEGAGGSGDGAVRAGFVVADTVKPTSAEAVAALRILGLAPVLLTGDNEAAARHVAARVGIDEVIAEVHPEDKVAHVKRLQAEGKVVAMAGNGVNDAAALSQADLGLAMGTGTDAVIAAADLTLVEGDLRGAVDAINPLIAGAAMASASVFVVSLGLRRFQPSSFTG
ncbi:hypothetical protein ASE01_20400 [Nocardioides sp. Root190]|nr:hypothetical protein ASE01_20400 [Nocardioides sp. Root190]